MNFLTLAFKNLVLKTIAYKKGAGLLSSFFLVTIVNFFTYKMQIPDSFFGISLGLICILSILIILDSFTGIIASRHEGHKVESGKLFFTFFKFLSAFLFFWLLDEVQCKLGLKIQVSGSYLKSFYTGAKETLEIVTYSIFLLLSLREWISIGENIERRYNKTFYLFQIVEKLFDLVEKKLIKWFENKEICK